MKRILAATILLVGLLLGIFAVAQANQTLNSGNTGSITAILSDELLLEKAYKAAIYAGMSKSISIQQIDLSKGVHTTFDKWLAFQGSEFGPEFVEAGIPQKPIFILPIEGEIAHSRGGGWGPEDSKSPTYDKIIIVIFADSGNIAWASSYPSDVPLPDVKGLIVEA